VTVNVPRRELASGINANVNAMARVGYLMLRKGVWGNSSILSNAVVARATSPTPENAGFPVQPVPADFPGATQNYGVLWWTNANGQMAGVPPDTFWAWGLHDTLIVVIPSLDLVVVRASNRSMRTNPEAWTGNYDVIQPLISQVVAAVTTP
jgi:CubicO group peptidase (beta-lactamase class C family)